LDKLQVQKLIKLIQKGDLKANILCLKKFLLEILKNPCNFHITEGDIPKHPALRTCSKAGSDGNLY
jgi:hypothetical protein